MARNCCKRPPFKVPNNGVAPASSKKRSVSAAFRADGSARRRKKLSNIIKPLEEDEFRTQGSLAFIIAGSNENTQFKGSSTNRREPSGTPSEGFGVTHRIADANSIPNAVPTDD